MWLMRRQGNAIFNRVMLLVVVVGTFYRKSMGFVRLSAGMASRLGAKLVMMGIWLRGMGARQPVLLKGVT